jgi:branched-chain amino acid transport system substrate-binding protein
LRAAGYIKAIMGASTIWDQKLIDGVGTSSEETYSSSAYIYPQNVGDSRGEEFLNAYREAYGTEPTVVAVTTYESANLIQQAIANGGPAREGVMEAMRKSDYDSMLGHVTFDQNGDRIEKFLVAGKVSDGAFHFVRKLDVVEQ